MAKTFRSDKYGDLEIPDNFENLSEEDQQTILRNAVKEKRSSQTSPMSALDYVKETMATGLQGLTLGTSEEIKAGLAELIQAPVTAFTEQEFGETYKRIRDKERRELEEYARQYPKSATAASIVGGIAPIVASTLIGGPAGGGAATASTLGRVKSAIDSSRLLAGGMTKPGATLGQKSAESAKTGGALGLAGGFGYSEGSPLETGLQTAGGGVIGSGLGAVLPPALSGTGFLLSKLFSPVISTGKKLFSKKTLDFTKEEEKEIEKISNLFLRDEVDIDEIILKIQQNVSADKLEDITPVEILADYGGDAVKRKLRGMKIEIPGNKIEKTLKERGPGSVALKGEDLLEDNVSNIQSTRIIKSLKNSADKVVKTEGINLESGIDELEQTIQKKVSPLYKKAFELNTKIKNLDVYKFLEVPIIKSAYEKARIAYLEETQKRNPGITVVMDDLGIPSLEALLIKNQNGQVIGVNKELPLAFLDQIKRAADSTTFALKKSTGADKIDSRTVSNRKDISNQFRDLLKNSVDGDDYINALSQSADKFALNEAYDLGLKAKTLTKSKFGQTIDVQYESLKTQAEKDAYKIGAFQNILNEIGETANTTNLAEKLTNKQALADKLKVLFSGSSDELRNFINRLQREDVIFQTGQKVLSGGGRDLNTQSEGFRGFLADAMVGLTEPTGSAGIRAQAKLAQQGSDILFDTASKQQKAFQDIILSRDPKKQQDILTLMKEMQELQRREAAQSNLLRSSTLRTTTPYSMESLNQLLFEQ